MRTALAAKPAVDFPKPETVVTVSIDPATGYVATPDCPEKRDEFYISRAGKFKPGDGEPKGQGRDAGERDQRRDVRAYAAESSTLIAHHLLAESPSDVERDGCFYS